MATNSTRGATFAWEIGKNCHLDSAGIGARQGAGGARDRDDNGVSWIEGTEGDDVGFGRQLDASDAAAAAALRTHCVGSKVKELGIGGDETQFLVAGRQFHGTDDVVTLA
jgi:hypothetical protein